MNSSQTNKNITNVIDIKVIMCYGYFKFIMMFLNKNKEERYHEHSA